MNTDGGTNILKDLLTVEEAAKELKLTPSSIRRMVGEEGKLRSRSATPAEIAALIAKGAIRGVPGTGIRVIFRSSVEKARGRKGQRRPKDTERT